MTPEELAELYHKSYEELAPHFNYETRNESKKPWNEVPENNRELMIAAARRVLSVIKRQQKLTDCMSECHLMAEHEQLKRDFAKYAQHTTVCESRLKDTENNSCPCTCGLEEILQRLKG